MNVIFVMSDTFRQDNISAYGPTKVKTPNLDRFAAQSFLFENAYAGSFPTVPNRLDIMTGRFSHIDHEWCPLPPEAVTLQQILHASGVTAQMIVDNPHLLEMGFNYSRGFTAWEWIRGQETDLWRSLPGDIRIKAPPGKVRTPFLVEGYLRNTAWWKSEEDHFAARTILSACNWLEEAAQESGTFFLYLDLFDPHEPWDAPQEYVDLYDPDYQEENLLYPNYGFWKEFLTEHEMKHVHAQYMAEATMVDRWFGVLLNKIKELGMAEDTAVIFTSDHGYLFGEHDLTGKSLFPEANGRIFYEAIPMYNDIRRTPLMIRLPGQMEGQRIDALVQAPDLMPTILEMAGLVTTETIGGQSHIQALQCGVFYAEDWEFQSENVHGKSLMPLMRGEASRLRDIAVTSNTLIYHTPLLARCSIVTEDGWCLHYAGNYEQEGMQGRLYKMPLVNPEGSRIPADPELFYLPDDPDELNNVIHKNEKLASEIHARYVKWLEELSTPEDHLIGRGRLR